MKSRGSMFLRWWLTLGLISSCTACSYDRAPGESGESSASVKPPAEPKTGVHGTQGEPRLEISADSNEVSLTWSGAGDGLVLLLSLTTRDMPTPSMAFPGQQGLQELGFVVLARRCDASGAVSVPLNRTAAEAYLRAESVTLDARLVRSMLFLQTAGDPSVMGGDSVTAQVELGADAFLSEFRFVQPTVSNERVRAIFPDQEWWAPTEPAAERWRWVFMRDRVLAHSNLED